MRERRRARPRPQRLRPQRAGDHDAWSGLVARRALGRLLLLRQHAATIIRLCELASGKTYDATEPTLFDLCPAFDPAGRYLYFIGAREFDPVVNAVQFEFSFPYGLRPYLITLRRDLRSPFAPLPTEDKAANQEDEQTKELRRRTP